MIMTTIEVLKVLTDFGFYDNNDTFYLAETLTDIIRSD